MNDELIKYYELLGVAPGASMQELKTAHRDLAKVWHPDRFAHDPRLQQKAQEKLKEINEAYDELASGKAGRRTRVSAQPNHSETPPTHARTRRTRWKLIVSTAIVFVILFFAVTRALIPRLKSQAQSSTQPAEQSQATLNEEEQPSESSNRARAADTARGKRADQQPAKEAKPDGGAPNFEQEARQMKPLPTVTLTIDPVSGMLAKADCPVKSRMTYPSGSEPHQYCNIQHQSAAPAQTEQGRPKESRLKSFAKRVAAPASRLFGSKGGSDTESRREAQSPGGNNR